MRWLGFVLALSLGLTIAAARMAQADQVFVNISKEACDARHGNWVPYVAGYTNGASGYTKCYVSSPVASGPVSGGNSCDALLQMYRGDQQAAQASRGVASAQALDRRAAQAAWNGYQQCLAGQRGAAPGGAYDDVLARTRRNLKSALDAIDRERAQEADAARQEQQQEGDRQKEREDAASSVTTHADAADAQNRANQANPFAANGNAAPMRAPASDQDYSRGAPQSLPARSADNPTGQPLDGRVPAPDGMPDKTWNADDTTQDGDADNPVCTLIRTEQHEAWLVSANPESSAQQKLDAQKTMTTAEHALAVAGCPPQRFYLKTPSDGMGNRG